MVEPEHEDRFRFRDGEIVDPAVLVVRMAGVEVERVGGGGGGGREREESVLTSWVTGGREEPVNCQMDYEKRK